MKPDIIKQLDGYDEIMKEIAITRKYGNDLAIDKDQVDEIINRYHPAHLQLKVIEIITETPSTKTFRLVPVNSELPPFLPGQYLSVGVTINGIRTSRPFSISSSPRQTAWYDITVRRVENGFVSLYMLDSVKIGDIFECAGPQGNFYHNPVFHEKTAVLISGGSGITPFMSMIREAAESNADRVIYLFYGNSNSEDIIFHSELTAIAKRWNGLKYYPVIEKPAPAFACREGFIDGKLIKEVLGTAEGKTFYVCGPQGLYDFCIPELSKLGLPRRKIRHEMFGMPAHISKQAGWPSGVLESDMFSVSVAGGKGFKARAGEPLLAALERAGIVLPSLCRSGECSLCRVKLTKGTVFVPSNVHVRSSDRENGYIHSCASYPVSDIEIRY